MRRSVPAVAAVVVMSLAVAAVGSVVRPSVARAAEPDRASTANWAGELASRAPAQPALTGSTMQLKVPKVSCPVGQAGVGPSMVSMWNGLGGWHGDVLYQAGVEATCAAGNDSPQYDAFYEVVRPDGGWGTDVVPHTVVTPLARYTVLPGDVITSRVHVSGDAVQFSLLDTRPGTRATSSTVRWKTSASAPIATGAGKPSSAECIVERPAITDPAGRTSLATLANFHTVFGAPADICTVTDSTGRSAAVGAPTSRWAHTTVVMTRDNAGGPLLAATHTPPTGSGRQSAVFWHRSA